MFKTIVSNVLWFQEKHEENNIEENLESLLKNLNHLRAKFQYTQQPESQIHIIKITANEISKILTNVL